MDEASVVPTVLLVIAGASAVCLLLRPSKPKPQPRKPSYDELKASGREDIEEALNGRGLLIDIIGESHRNSDGAYRQEIIAKCAKRDKIKLKREPDNPYDKNAILAVSPYGAVGYVKREIAEQLSALMDDGLKIDAEISLVAGGTEGKPSRGIWIAAYAADE